MVVGTGVGPAGTVGVGVGVGDSDVVGVALVDSVGDVGLVVSPGDVVVVSVGLVVIGVVVTGSLGLRSCVRGTQV